MTANEIRDVGYLQWRDPWAWMESMRGKRWESYLQKEKRRYHHLTQQPSVAPVARKMKQELTDARQYLYLGGFQAGSGQLDIVLTPESQFYWKRSWHKRYKKAYDLDVTQDAVWYVTETDTPYVQELRCEDHTGHRKWTKADVTAEVAVVDQWCYYIRVVEGDISVLYCCDADTGLRARKVMEERNPERYLSLIKGNHRTLYLQSEDPSRSETYLIRGKTAHPVFRGSLFQIPLGGETALLRYATGQPWKAVGHPVSAWKLPQEEIEWANAHTGHLISIHEGTETLWYCAAGVPAKPLLRLKAGSFAYNAWDVWESSPHPQWMVQSPFSVPFMIRAVQSTIHRVAPSWPIARPVRFKPLEVHKWHATSADGTQVPYVVVYEKGVVPKAQVVYVYGAYGSSTPVQWPHAHWSPLLTRGWSIVYAMVRGGGDDTDTWADAARREHRHRTVEDYEAVIRGAQHRLRLSPRQTVLYGRSAGGVAVGAIVARWPKGEVAGAVFTEVPYVDVLRTSTNPSLPLTVGEYKEFGNPLKRAVDFNAMVHVSPMNSLPAQGAPGVFVISRVGLQDRQVFAYESFKWIQRLRGHVSPDDEKEDDPKQKYVTVEKKEEHVYRSSVYPHFRGIDLAILEAWIEDRLRFP